jgi:uncharacterized protein YceK
MKTIVIVLALISISGCATNVSRPGYGYMVPACQKFHDKGQFDLWAQCSQSIRNIEAQIGQRIITEVLKK